MENSIEGAVSQINEQQTQINQTATSKAPQTKPTQYDLWDVRMTHMFLPKEPSEKQELNTQDIKSLFPQMLPLVKPREEALKDYKEKFKTDSGFNEFYSYVQKEALDISLNKPLDANQRYNTVWKSLLNPEGRKLGLVDNTGETTTSYNGQEFENLTQQEKIESAGFYKSKTGNFRRIADFNHDESNTYLMANPLNPNASWVEVDQNESNVNKIIRSEYGPSKMYSEGLSGSILRGIKSSLYQLPQGIVNFNQAVDEMFGVNHERNEEDSRVISNIAKYHSYQSEEEKKGMLSGDANAFLYGVANGFGSIATNVAATFATGGVAGGAMISGAMMGGLFFEEARQQGLDTNNPFLGLVSLSAGAVAGMVEQVSTADVDWMFKNKSILTKEILKDLPQAIDYKNITAEGKAAFVKNVASKILAFAEKAKSSKISTKLVAGIGEGLEEETQRITDEIFKNSYNAAKQAQKDIYTDQYNSELNKVNDEMSLYSIKEDGKYFKGNTEISSNQYDTERNALRNKQNELIANKPGETRLFDTDWGKLVPFKEGFEEFAGGFFGALPFGMGAQKERQIRIIDQVNQYGLEKVLSEINTLHKAGAFGPTNISAENKSIFDSINNPSIKSVNDLNAEMARNEVYMAHEILTNTAVGNIIKSGKDVKYEGTSLFVDDIKKDIGEILSVKKNIAERKDALFTAKDEEKEQLEKDIKPYEERLASLEEKLSKYTDPKWQGKKLEDGTYEFPNQTKYPFAFREFAKDSILKYNGSNATPQSFRNYKNNRERVINEVIKKREDEIAQKQGLLNEVGELHKGALSEKNDVDKLRKINSLFDKLENSGVKLSSSQSADIVSQLGPIQKKIELEENYAYEQLLKGFSKANPDIKQDSNDFEDAFEDYRLSNKIPIAGKSERDSIKRRMGSLENTQEIEEQLPKPYSKQELSLYFDRNKSKVQSIQDNSSNKENFFTVKNLEALSSYMEDVVSDIENLKAEKTYDVLKKGGFEVAEDSPIKESVDLTGDHDVVKHIPISEEQRQSFINSLNEQRAKLLTLIEAVREGLKLSKSTNIEYMNNDIKSKLHIIQTIKGFLEPTLSKQVSDALSSDEFKKALDILDSKKDTETRLVAFNTVEFTVKYVNALLYKNKAITSKKNGKPLYELILDSYMQRTPIANFSYTAVHEYVNNSHEELLAQGVVFDDNLTKMNIYNSSFLMNYVSNYLMVVSSVNDFDVHTYFRTFPSTEITPSYEQIEIEKSIAAAHFNGKNDIVSYVQKTLNKLSKTNNIDTFIDHAIFLRGYAGAGKSTVVLSGSLKLINFLENKKRQIHAFAPTSNLTETLNKSLSSVNKSNPNITFNTGLFTDFESRVANIQDGDIIVFDEATLLSKEQMSYYKSAIDKMKADGKTVTTLFMGDESQTQFSNLTVESPAAFHYMQRTVPLTKVFRTGVVDLANFQSSLRRGTQIKPIEKADIKLMPNSYFVSDEKSLGLQLSQSVSDVINNFYEKFLADEKSDNNQKTILVVKDSNEREKYIKELESRGINASKLSDSIFTLDESENKVQGLEADNVYVVVEQGNIKDKGHFQNLLTAATRAKSFLNIYWEKSDDFSKGKIVQSKALAESGVAISNNAFSNEDKLAANKALTSKEQSFYDKYQNSNLSTLSKEQQKAEDFKSATKLEPKTSIHETKSGIKVQLVSDGNSTQISLLENPSDFIIVPNSENMTEAIKGFLMERDLLKETESKVEPDGTVDLNDKIEKPTKQAVLDILKLNQGKKHVVRIPSQVMPITVYTVDNKNILNTITGKRVTSFSSLPTLIDSVDKVEKIIDPAADNKQYEGKIFEHPIHGFIVGDFIDTERFEGKYKVTEAGKENTYLTFNGGTITLKESDVIGLKEYTENATETEEELQQAQKTDDERKFKFGGEFFQNKKLPISLHSTIMKIGSDTSKINELRQLRAEIIKYIVENSARNPKMIIFQDGLPDGYSFVKDDGSFGNASELGVTFMANTEYLSNDLKQKVVTYGDVTAALYLGSMYLPDLGFDGKLDKQTVQSNLSDALDKIIQSFDPSDKYAFTNAKFSLFKACALINGAFSLKGSLKLNLEKAGKIITGKKQSILSIQNNPFYGKIKINQFAKKSDGKARTVGVVPINGTNKTFELYLEARYLSDDVIEDYIKEVSSIEVKQRVAKTPALVSENRKEMDLIKKTKAFQTLFYNNQELSNLKGIASAEAIFRFDKKYVEIQGRNPVELKANTIAALKYLKGNTVAKLRENPNDATKLDGSGTMVLAADNVFVTSVERINDPIATIEGIAIDEKAFNPEIAQKYLDAIEKLKEHLGPKPKHEINESDAIGLDKLKNNEGFTDLDFQSKQEAIDTVKSILGEDYGLMNTGFFEGLTNSNGDAVWGFVKNLKIMLDLTNGKVLKRAVSHEVMHFVNQYMIDSVKRKELYSHVRNVVNKEMTNLEVEEWLAEKFETFNPETGEYSKDVEKRTILSRFFDWLRNLMYSVRDSEQAILSHMEKISKGGFKNAPIVETSNDFTEEFNKLKKEKINYNAYSTIVPEFGDELGSNIALSYLRRIIFESSPYNNDITKAYTGKNIEQVLSSIQKDVMEDSKGLANQKVTLEIPGKDGTYTEQIEVSKVSGKDFIYLKQTSDLLKVIQYRVGKTEANGENRNFRFLVKKLMPNVNVVELTENKIGDTTLSKSNLLFDGVGSVSNSLKFIFGGIRWTKKNTGENGVIKNENGFIDGDKMFKDLNEIGINSGFLLHGYDSKGVKFSVPRIVLLKQKIESILENARQDGTIDTDQKVIELNALYKHCLKDWDSNDIVIGDKGKVKAVTPSYYALNYQKQAILADVEAGFIPDNATYIDEDGNEKHIPLTQIIEEKHKAAADIVSRINEDVVTLQKNRFINLFHKVDFKGNIKVAIEKYRNTNEVEIIRDLKKNMFSRFYSGSTILMATDKMIMNFTGHERTEDGTYVFNERKRNYTVNQKEKKIFVRMNVKSKGTTSSKNVFLMSYEISKDGTLKFTKPEFDSQDHKVAMLKAFSYLSNRVIPDNVFTRLYSLKDGKHLQNDSAIDSSLLYSFIGTSLISMNNMVNETIDSIVTGADEEQGISKNPNYSNLNDAVKKTTNVNVDEQDNDLIGGFKHSDLVRPEDMFIYHEKLAKLTSASRGDTWTTFALNSDGTKVYILNPGSFITRVFQNSDEKSSKYISEYVNSLANAGNEYAKKLLNNAIISGKHIIESLEVLTGIKNSYGGKSLNNITTYDLINSFVGMFEQSVKNNIGTKKYRIPSMVMGRDYLPVFNAEFEESLFKEINGNQYVTNDEFYWKHIQMQLQKAKDVAEENISLLDAKLAQYLGGIHKQSEKQSPQDKYKSVQETLSKHGKDARLIEAFMKDKELRRVQHFNVLKEKGTGTPYLSFGKAVEMYIGKNKHKVYNLDNTKKYLDKELVYTENYSTIDEMFKPLYDEFNTLLSDSSFSLNENLQGGFGKEYDAKYYFAHNREYQDYLDEVKSIRSNSKLSLSEQDNLINQKSKPKTNVSLLHPFLKGLYFGFHINDNFTSQLTSGEDYQYKDFGDYIKRSAGKSASSKLISIDNPRGIKDYFNTVIINGNNHLHKLSTRFKDFVDASDGQSILNPITSQLIKNTSEELTGSYSSFKITNYNKSFDKDEVIYEKTSHMQINDDMLNTSDVYQAMMQYMMPADLYEDYVSQRNKGVSFEDAINSITERVISENRYDELIHQISFDSANKVTQRATTDLESIISNNKDLSNIHRSATNNLMIQLKAENDITETDSSHPSQILSFLGIGNIANAEIAYQKLSEKMKRHLDKINNNISRYEKMGLTRDEAVRKWILKEQKRKSTGMLGSFSDLINNNVINLPNTIQIGMNNIVSMFNQSIKPKINGVRLNQVTDVFTNVYESNGNVYYKDDLNRLGITDAVPRKLKPMQFLVDGKVLQSEQDFIDAIVNKKVVTTIPGEVLAPFSYAEQFGIDANSLFAQQLGHAPTLDEAMSVRLNDGTMMRFNMDGNFSTLINENYDNVNDARFEGKDIEDIIQYFMAFEKSLNIYANRIPSHSFATGGVYKIVGFLNNSGSSIITSAEKMYFDGSDFDIDQLSIYFPAVKKDEQGNFNIPDTDEDDDGLNNQILSAITNSYLAPTPEFLDILTSPTTMKNLKALKDAEMDKGKVKYNTRGDISSNIKAHSTIADGDGMIGIVANLNKVYGNLVYAHKKLKGTAFAASLEKNFKSFANDYKVSDERNRYVIDLIGEFLQASVDNTKELILGYLNINSISFKPVSAMILDGENENSIIEFITKPIIEKVISRLENSLRINNFSSVNYLGVIDSMIDSAKGKTKVSDLQVELNNLTKEANEISSAIEKSPVEFDENGNAVQDLQEFDLQEIQSKISFIELQIELSEQGQSVSDNEMLLRKLKEYMIKGEYLERASAISGLNQGVKPDMYVYDKKINDLEFYFGSKLEDIKSNFSNYNFEDKYQNLSPENHKLVMAKEMYIRDYMPSLKEFANSMPHISSIIDMLNNLKQIKKSLIYYSDGIETVKNQILEKTKNNAFSYRGQFYDFYSGVSDFIIDMYFSLRENKGLGLKNMYYDENTKDAYEISPQHNLGTPDGRKMFYDEFPFIIEEIKNVYEQQLQNENYAIKRNAFLDLIKVDNQGKGTTGMKILLENSFNLSDMEKSKGMKGFAMLNETITQLSKNNVFFEKYNGIDFKHLMRCYDLGRYGFNFKQGSMQDLIGCDPYKTDKTLLKKVSDFIDHTLSPVMNNNTDTEVGYEQSVIRNALKAMPYVLPAYHVDSITSLNKQQKETLEKTIIIARENFKENSDNRIYPDLFKGGDYMLTDIEFATKFYKEFSKRYDKSTGQYVQQIRRIVDSGTKNFHVTYDDIRPSKSSLAKPFSSGNNSIIFNTPVIKNLEVNSIKQLRAGKYTKEYFKNTKDLFPGDTKNGLIYVPLVGYVSLYKVNDINVQMKSLGFWEKGDFELWNMKQLSLEGFTDEQMKELHTLKDLMKFALDFVPGYKKSLAELRDDFNAFKKGGLGDINEYSKQFKNSILCRQFVQTKMMHNTKL